jgi:hypothetical protein
MFTHLAQYKGGPKDGHRNTIPSEDPAPPPVLFVAADILPGLRFERARYERCEDGHYEFAGVSR